MHDLKDKVILVTGASSGLGAATVRKLAASGAKVALAARRLDKCQAIVDEIEGSGGEAFAVQTDVRDSEAVDAMVEKTVAHFGRLDCAFNNAGIAGTPFTAAADVLEQDWSSVIDMNLTSVWRCMKAEVPAILKSGGGAIVNNSSMYGLIGSEIGHAPYSAAKHGVIGLTKSAAIDYAQSGLRVNAVCPGFCHSEMVDPYVEAEAEMMAKVINRTSAMNRLGESKEVADVVAWLLSGSSSFVNGAAIPIEGGPTSKLY